MRATETEAYLKTVFGGDLSVSDYQFPADAPVWMRLDYTAACVAWEEQSCIVLHPVSSGWRLPVLKTQLAKFREICQKPCALCLDHLTALQRRNLLENHVPFLVPGLQVYFPFWGCAFTEKFSQPARPAEKMVPGTQLVFLYLYYRMYYGAEQEKINLTQLAEQLHLSKATCTRAARDLTELGLLTTETEGTKKWILPAGEKSGYLRRGYARLQSPLARCIYVKPGTNLPQGPLGGIRALSEISMLAAGERDGSVVLTREAAAEIPPAARISRQEYDDFGGSVVEIWSYAPARLPAGRTVDEISLLLTLQADPDERVQQALDGIRRRHALPVEEEVN